MGGQYTPTCPVILVRDHWSNWPKYSLKQDYRNFKTFLGGEIPTHMDYIDVDSSPDLIRFIKINKSYYDFLLRVEEGYPLFNENEHQFIKYLSAFLPLTRPYEFFIIQHLIQDSTTYEDLLITLSPLIPQFSKRSFDHAIGHLQNQFYSIKEQAEKLQFVYEKEGKLNLSIPFENELFKNFVYDLLNYGLYRVGKEFGEYEGLFKLYAHYSRIQFLQGICSNTMAFREGIKYVEDDLYLFIDLKKDENKSEWLLYKDEFKTSKILQWESSTSTTLDSKLGLELIKQKQCHLFVRKIKKEDGIVQPYIYIGKGELTNPSESDNPKKTLIFDILLENQIPSYLQFEFGI